ncbi:hypothetical protein GCM10022284_56970 [Streptomyces hundungensis]
MKLTLDDGWTATVTVPGDPLRVTPRFDFRDFCVRVAPYADVDEHGRFLLDTFGSGPWLWDAPDELRFDPAGRELVGAELQLPSALADFARAGARPGRCGALGRGAGSVAPWTRSASTVRTPPPATAPSPRSTRRAAGGSVNWRGG